MARARLIFMIAIIGAAAPFLSFAQNKNNADIEFNKIILKIGSQSEAIANDEYSDWIKIEPKLYVNSREKSEIENINYCPLEPVFCEYLMTRRGRLFVGKRSDLSVNKNKIVSFLDDLARRMNKDPVDAKFQMKDGKISVFALAENGLRLNIEKSLEIMTRDFTDNIFPKSGGKEINLSYETIEPEIKSSEVENLGIDSLIGEGKSNFKGSPKNRIFNINVAANRFNGVLIKPGEEFSFVKILGEVDEEHGYLPELVIKRDKTEPEFGGGICQASTTTFRAAIYSGLKITARRNHAYPVRYYNPQGMDATVYIPRPDLRFINNTPGYILIQTKIEGTNLIFDFYGTNDGRTIEIEGPKITESNPDGSMKATFTQIVKDKDGNVMLEDVFNSVYDSPSKYPHPGEEKLAKKPDGWSDREWKEYKKANGL